MQEKKLEFFALLCFGASFCSKPAPSVEFVDHSASDESPVFVSRAADTRVEVPTEPKVRIGSTVMLVGDSLGSGMSDKFRKLAKGSGYNPVVRVISGTSTFQWVFWIKKHIAEHKPSLVLVSLGTNDAVQLERAKALNVYANMSKIIKDSGSELVWILPHRISKDRIPKIDSAREFIRTTVPMSFDSTKIEVPLAPDGVHTSTRGYELWVEEVWKWTKETNMIEANHR